MAAPLMLVLAPEALAALAAALKATAAALAAVAGGVLLADAINQVQNEGQEGAEGARENATTTCKECLPNPQCAKWLDEVQRALYSVKKPKELGGDGRGQKGLMQMICEWIHGSLAGGANHEQSVLDAMNTIKNNSEKRLRDPKNKCPVPPEVIKDMDEMIDQAGTLESLSKLLHLPRADFKEHCVEKALQIAAQRLGR